MNTRKINKGDFIQIYFDNDDIPEGYSSDFQFKITGVVIDFLSYECNSDKIYATKFFRIDILSDEGKVGSWDVYPEDTIEIINEYQPDTLDDLKS